MQRRWMIGCLALGTLISVAAESTRIHTKTLSVPVDSVSMDSVPMDSSYYDSIADDTLRSVIVTPDGRIPVRIRKPQKQPSVPSVSDILGKKLTDMIMHPFAFGQRKRERHRKKMMKLLREYEQLKTPREEIIEALRKEGINVDSLLQLHEK